MEDNEVKMRQYVQDREKAILLRIEELLLKEEE